MAQFPQYREGVSASMSMQAYVEFKAVVDSLLVD